MDGNSSDRGLWQNAYTFIAERVRGIVSHRRVQHAFQQMRGLRHHCPEWTSVDSSRETFPGRVTDEQSHFVSSGEVDYMASAAAECGPTTSGGDTESGCACVIDCAEAGRVVLLASGALPSSSTGCAGEASAAARGGAAAAPLGHPGPSAAEREPHLRSNPAQRSAREIDEQRDEERWAQKLPSPQQPRRPPPPPANLSSLKGRRQREPEADCEGSARNTASFFSVVASQQGNPNMTTLIDGGDVVSPAVRSNASPAAPTRDSRTAGVATTLSSCPHADDCADRAHDTHPGRTASPIAMETGDDTEPRSSLADSQRSFSSAVDSVELSDSSCPVPPAHRVQFRLNLRQTQTSGGGRTCIDLNACGEAHGKHAKAAPGNEQMGPAYSAERVLLRDNLLVTQSHANRIEESRISCAPATDQTSQRVIQGANYAGARRDSSAGTHVRSVPDHNGAISHPEQNSRAKLSLSLRSGYAGGAVSRGGHAGVEGDDTVISPVTQSSAAVCGSHLSNDTGGSVLNGRADNEMPLDCCEQFMENHDTAPDVARSRRNASRSSGGEPIDNVAPTVRERRLTDFEESRRLEDHVLVVLDDLEQALSSDERTRNSEDTTQRRRRKSKRKKCTDVCNGHDVVFPSDMERGSRNPSTACWGDEREGRGGKRNRAATAAPDARRDAGCENAESAMEVDEVEQQQQQQQQQQQGAFGGGGGGSREVTGNLLEDLSEWTEEACSGPARRTVAASGHLTPSDQSDIFRELDAMCECSIEDILADEDDTEHGDGVFQQATHHETAGQGRRTWPNTPRARSNVANDARQQRLFTSPVPPGPGVRAQLRFGLPHLNLVQLFRNLLRNFYYETFLWMYLNVLLHPRSSTTRNRLRFLGMLSNQSTEAVLLNVLLGYFNGFHGGRHATIRDSLRLLGEIAGRGGGYVDSRQAVWLRELAVDVGIHYSPRQMLRAFSTVVRDILMTRVPPLYCMRYVC